jgi:hypothetical protein
MHSHGLTPVNEICFVSIGKSGCGWLMQAASGCWGLLSSCINQEEICWKERQEAKGSYWTSGGAQHAVQAGHTSDEEEQPKHTLEGSLRSTPPRPPPPLWTDHPAGWQAPVWCAGPAPGLLSGGWRPRCSLSRPAAASCPPRRCPCRHLVQGCPWGCRCGRRTAALPASQRARPGTKRGRGPAP